MSTDYASIDELPNLTSQEVFNRAYLHVMKNGRPSIDSDGICTYGGIGCAAAPFLKEELRDITNGGWRYLVMDGRVSRAHDRLIHKLQIAHDEAAYIPRVFGVQSFDFTANFAFRMAKVAEQYGLTIPDFNIAEE